MLTTSLFDLTYRFCHQVDAYTLPSERGKSCRSEKEAVHLSWHVPRKAFQYLRLAKHYCCILTHPLAGAVCKA